VESGSDNGDVFLPSLLSPLFLFSTPSPLFFSVVFSFSPLSLRGHQRWLGGALWRWRGSMMAAVVVFLFFLCHFLFFPASLMTSFSLLCLPFCFLLFKFPVGAICFSLNLSSLSISPLFFFPYSFYFQSLSLHPFFRKTLLLLSFGLTSFSLQKKLFISLSRSPSLSLSLFQKNPSRSLLSFFLQHPLL